VCVISLPLLRSIPVAVPVLSAFPVVVLWIVFILAIVEPEARMIEQSKDTFASVDYFLSD
jgi:hypothetical protein